MTNDLPTLPPAPPASPESVTPPPPPAAPAEAPPAPAPAEETPPVATGENVAAEIVAPPEAPAPAAEQSQQAEEQPAEAPAPEPEAAVEEPPSNKHWYVVKVQSGREETIKEAIERRVKIEGLEEYFGQIVIPVEKVVEMRNSKRVTRERKLYPGYIMAEVEYNDRILYLFRETSGVGDFVGAGVNRAPTPMTPAEVTRMTRKGGGAGKDKEEPKEIHGKPPVERGERVKVKDGMFAGMEGEVKEIFEAKSQLKVELTVFGRPVSVEFEYWQVEAV